MGSSTMDLGMISKLLMDLDMSPEEYVQLNNEEIKQIMLERRERADAETAVSCHRSSVLAQQRAGQAQYIARLQPLQPWSCHWAVSYTDRNVVDQESNLQEYCISICQNPEGYHDDDEGYTMGARVTFGRPTVDDIISALQVAMAFPLVGKGKRPYEVLVAWRLCDMWPKLEKWLREMEILPCLERRDEAAVTSAAHGLHIEGRNNPKPTIPDPLTPSQQLRNEGNSLFILRRYAKAADKYTEALREEPESAVLYGNRAIAHLHMGLHAKALADAEDAILLDPEYSKAHARKGLALLRLGRKQEARKHYQQCVHLFKHNSQFKSALQQLEGKTVQF